MFIYKLKMYRYCHLQHVIKYKCIIYSTFVNEMIYRLKFVTIRFPQYLKRIYFGHGTYVVFDHNYKRFGLRQSIFPIDFTLYKDDLDCRPLTTQNLAAVGFFACLR